jgi:hypothetical protein
MEDERQKLLLDMDLPELAATLPAWGAHASAVLSSPPDMSGAFMIEYLDAIAAARLLLEQSASAIHEANPNPTPNPYPTKSTRFGVTTCMTSSLI